MWKKVVVSYADSDVVLILLDVIVCAQKKDQARRETDGSFVSERGNNESGLLGLHGFHFVKHEISLSERL